MQLLLEEMKHFIAAIDQEESRREQYSLVLLEYCLNTVGRDVVAHADDQQRGDQ